MNNFRKTLVFGLVATLLLAPGSVLAQDALAIKEAKAHEIIKKGEDLVRTGTWWTQRKEVLGGDGQPQVSQEAKAKGEKMIADGEKLIAEGKALLENVKVERQKLAEQRRAASMKHYTVELTESPLIEALGTIAKPFLADLWLAEYSDLHFSGVFVNIGDGIKQAEKASEEIAWLLEEADKEKVTLSVTKDFVLGSAKDAGGKDRNHLVYADGKDPRGAAKAAVIYVEIIPAASGKKALVSMRAADLDSWEIVNSKIFTTPLGGDVLEKLGVTERELASASTPAPTSAAVSDPSNYTGVFGRARDRYSFRYSDEAGHSRSEAALRGALAKHIIATNSDALTTDTDFITKAFPNKDGVKIAPYETAVWVLKDAPEGAGQQLFARSLAQGKDVEVGSVKVATSGEDLTAAPEAEKAEEAADDSSSTASTEGDDDGWVKKYKPKPKDE